MLPAMRSLSLLGALWISTLASSTAGPGCAGRSHSQVLSEGTASPALQATAHDGTTVDTRDLGGKPMLVYFYPKDDTPGCTKEACAFRDVWDRYQSAGVSVVGVSADSNASHEEFAAKHELPFPLIADEQLVWAKAFGVGTTFGMTQRDSFLLAPDGTIAKVYRGVDPGVHADEVLRDAAALSPPAEPQ